MSTAGFHITEDCAEVYLQNESGMEFLQLARRLHDYLQQGQRLPARSLFEATDGCKEISREAFDALAKRRMENTGEVSGVFELDFDARTFSALNIMDGWKAYAMDDIAAAAEAAFQEAEISEDVDSDAGCILLYPAGCYRDTAAVSDSCLLQAADT